LRVCRSAARAMSVSSAATRAAARVRPPSNSAYSRENALRAFVIGSGLLPRRGRFRVREPGHRCSDRGIVTGSGERGTRGLAPRVRDRFRMVQLLQREIGRGELSLREERPEHEHGLIAPLPRLGEVDLRKEPCARLRDPLFGLLHRRPRHGNVWIGRHRRRHGRRQRKRFLGTRQIARGQHNNQQHGGQDSLGCGHPHLKRCRFCHLVTHQGRDVQCRP